MQIPRVIGAFCHVWKWHNVQRTRSEMRRCTTHALYRSKLWQQDYYQHPQNANPDGSTLEGTAQRIGRSFGGGGAEGHIIVFFRTTILLFHPVLVSCFDLIRSHQQCILWSPPLEIEPATTDCRAETLQLSKQSILHTQNVDLYPFPWSHNNYADVYFQSSCEDVALEVTVSSVKSTDVTCKTHPG